MLQQRVTISYRTITECAQQTSNTKAAALPHFADLILYGELALCNVRGTLQDFDGHVVDLRLA
jgi:hypothetical protein